jgi:hypothetical protein
MPGMDYPHIRVHRIEYVQGMQPRSRCPFRQWPGAV